MPYPRRGLMPCCSRLPLQSCPSAPHQYAASTSGQNAVLRRRNMPRRYSSDSKPCCTAGAQFKIRVHNLIFLTRRVNYTCNLLLVLDFCHSHSNQLRLVCALVHNFMCNALAMRNVFLARYIRQRFFKGMENSGIIIVVYFRTPFEVFHAVICRIQIQVIYIRQVIRVWNKSSYSEY